jgi:hypothetical protein
MQYDTDMSYEQYWQANRACLVQTSRSRRWNFWFTWYVAPIIGVTFWVAGIVLYRQIGEFSGPVGLNFVFGASLVWCRFQFSRKVRKLYEQQASHFVGRMTVEPSGLDYERHDGTAKVHYSWNAFTFWIERPEEFLLIPGPGSFVRISKGKLTTDEQNQVRKWMTSSKHPN